MILLYYLDYLAKIFMTQPLKRPPTIHLSQAELFYPSFPVFSNLNLTLEGGKWTTLLGRSGIGKSSLLRLIAGLVDPQYTHFNLQTSDQEPLINRIAYLSQQDSLLPWLSVLDNVLIGARLRKEKTQPLKERALFLLQKAGLEHVVSQRPHQLSGGQLQRAVLVRTFMEERSVILMDEPFAQLDAVTKLSLQELAASLFKDYTVFLVTHDPLEALRLSHAIYVMNGSPPQLKKVISLSTPIPRELSDPELFRLQASLFTELQEGHPHAAK